MLTVDLETLFANLPRIAEPGARLRARVVDRNAVPPQLFLAHGEMEIELVVDLALERAVPQRQSQQSPLPGPDAHANSGDVCASAATIAFAWRCQTRDSARYRARPAAVSV